MEPLLRARRVTSPRLEEAARAVPADAEQLAQVVRNLLENAVRHGREGGVVRLSVGPGEDGGRRGRGGARGQPTTGRASRASTFPA